MKTIFLETKKNAKNITKPTNKRMPNGILNNVF